jgi:hypothetical protein
MPQVTQVLLLNTLTLRPVRPEDRPSREGKSEGGPECEELVVYPELEVEHVVVPSDHIRVATQT